MDQVFTEADVVGTYADYLSHLAKMTPETPFETRSFETRMVAALDADEAVRQALARVTTFLEAAGDHTAPLLAEGELGTPGVEGSATGLWLDDVQIVVEALRRRNGA